MAKSPSPPNNTLPMPSEKADNPGAVLAGFDASIDVSPAAPLDPKALPALGAVYLLSDADDSPIFLSVCENLRRVVPPRLAADANDEPTKRAAYFCRSKQRSAMASRFRTGSLCEMKAAVMGS